jgi:hypothetical protein
VIQELACHDLRTRVPKRLRAIVLFVDHRANSVLLFQEDVGPYVDRSSRLRRPLRTSACSSSILSVNGRSDLSAG